MTNSYPHISELKRMQTQPRRNKYGAKGTYVDGFYFPSQKEARFYEQLCLAKKAGVVSYFLRQVPFHLPGNVTYRVDFVVFHPGGRVDYIDVKGKRTKAYIRNKKQVEALYPVEIVEA